MTLDEWIEKTAGVKGLANDISIHLNVWNVDDPETLLRMIMISMRQWHEDDILRRFTDCNPKGAGKRNTSAGRKKSCP